MGRGEGHAGSSPRTPTNDGRHGKQGPWHGATSVLTIHQDRACRHRLADNPK